MRTLRNGVVHRTSSGRGSSSSKFGAIKNKVNRLLNSAVWSVSESNIAIISLELIESTCDVEVDQVDRPSSRSNTTFTIGK